MTTTTTRSVADVLREAKALIEPSGKWRKGSWLDNSGASCASGAINRACGFRDGVVTTDEATKQKVREIARAKLIEATGDWCIIGWNDAPGRTHQEVLDAFSQEASHA